MFHKHVYLWYGDRQEIDNRTKPYISRNKNKQIMAKIRFSFIIKRLQSFIISTIVLFKLLFVQEIFGLEQTTAIGIWWCLQIIEGVGEFLAGAKDIMMLKLACVFWSVKEWLGFLRKLACRA
jgi:hypothetical protein